MHECFLLQHWSWEFCVTLFRQESVASLHECDFANFILGRLSHQLSKSDQNWIVEGLTMSLLCCWVAANWFLHWYLPFVVNCWNINVKIIAMLISNISHHGGAFKLVGYHAVTDNVVQWTSYTLPFEITSECLHPPVLEFLHYFTVKVANCKDFMKKVGTDFPSFHCMMNTFSSHWINHTWRHESSTKSM